LNRKARGPQYQRPGRVAQFVLG